ncbi:MAG TPA: hypothetical protein VD927_05235 [Chryseosolibacter sp.]|nr:hypothetical protein [Chryseosolibacter sp.]
MKTILMLEHDDDDRYIAQAVFDEHHYPIKLEFVSSSVDFFAYLRSCEKNRSKLPSLILLNYYAVPDNAIDTLRKLKRDITFGYIPTVVLSGTVDDSIVRECYAEGASSVIQKPDSAGDTNEKIACFVKYWFSTVELV